ncbi:MAG: NAD-dependent epimerase/dehydratase [Candidatus Eremiobacteraeota bacterium]|nr:NAD-dependent epimerase/dehydratase [Candidatus Eremiobacteraeota bacterium]
MAVLVTGGAGFVGSHLVDRLVSQGRRVVVVDDLSTGRLSNLQRALSSGRVVFAYGDIAASTSALADLLNGALDEPLTTVFHLASPASPEAYGEHPWETLAANAIGTMACIELALEHGAKLLFTSTSEVYGDPLVHPQPETYFGNVNPIGPRSCYDEGKRFGEAAVAAAMRARGLDGRIVRIFNGYGPRMERGDGRLIPALIAAAHEGRPFPIHGTGAQTRSLTYVDDLVSGILTVANAPLQTPQPVNLGTDEETSVIDVARRLATVAGVGFEVEHLPARPEDPQRRRPDPAFAASLGWVAQTRLDDGLRTTHRWFAEEGMAYV